MNTKSEATTTAFILKTVPYKENDRMVYAYTKDFGKLTFIAKGVNKINSKNASSLQELTYVELVMIPKKGISTLIKASIIDFYTLIKEDLELQIYASYIMEYVNKQEEDNVPDPKVFKVIKQAMVALKQGYPTKLVYSLFNLKMLTIAGTALEVNACAHCHEVRPIVSISIQEGGFICSACLKSQDVLFSKEQLKLFRHMALLGFDRIDDIVYSKKDLSVLCQVIEQFVEEYSGIYFQTKKFIKTLLNEM